MNWHSIRAFFADRLWQEELSGARGWRGLGVTVLRVASYSGRRFRSDQGGLRASGLTLVTMLALVPVLALASGIAKGLGYGEMLDSKLAELLNGAPGSMQPALEQIRRLVARTSFGALGVVGSLLLVYSGLQLFVRIEQALNRVWEVEGRPWYRRITDFVALIVLVPVLVLAALSMHSLLQGAVWFGDVPWLDQLYHTGVVGAVPHVLVWVAFTALYRLMPAAEVRWGAAATAGVIAGSGWLFVHQLYLAAQFGVARANAIYATLAALPLLLVYLQLTWTVILLGAELGHAIQHRRQLPGPNAVTEAPPALREQLALHLVHRVCRSFQAAEPGPRLEQVAAELGLREDWLAAVFHELERGGVLGRVERGGGLVPLRPPADLTVGEVVDVLRGGVGDGVRERLSLPASVADGLRDVDRERRTRLGALPVLSP